MNGKPAFGRTVLFLAVVSGISGSGSPARAVETYVTRTNWAERTITNVIEVTVPLNRFVNEFHTNRVEQLRTNVVEVLATNVVTRTITNRLVLDAFRTNVVFGYATNLKVLNLTNWQTVLVMKTNWVTQSVTNTIQLDLPANRAVVGPRAGAEPRESSGESVPAATASAVKEGLVLEAAKTDRYPVNNHVEVEMRVRSAGGEGPLQVLKWRVEKEDGSILSFGQEADFKRQLPVGRYKVEARVQRAGDNPVQVVRGTLDVTLREAVIRQPLLGQN